MRAELADGRVLEFPDGTDPAVVQSTVKRVLGGDLESKVSQIPGNVVQPPAQQDRTMMDRIKGAGEAALSTATGVIGGLAAPFVAPVRGLVNPPTERGPNAAGNYVADTARSMTYSPRTEAGQEYAGKVGSALSNLAAIPPSEMMTLASLAPPAANYLRAQSESEAAALNAARSGSSANLAQAKSLGMKVSPAEANPSVLNQITEGFAGQAKTQKLMSAKNQPRIDNLGRQALGLSEEVPLTIETMETVRREAGQAYENIRNAGRIKTDNTMRADLNNIVSKFEGAEKDFPKMAQTAVRDAVDTARVASFDASSGVDAIKIQRGLADKAFRQGDAALGKAHKAIADAIESQIERGLQNAGPTKMLADFRHAREVIAKSYDIQKSLKGGHVDGRTLAGQLKKGRPLSGELKDIATFAENYPKSSQTLQTSGYPGPDYGDILMGGVGYLADPTLATLAASRPLTRSALASGPYQSMFVRGSNATPSKMLSLSELASRNRPLNASIPMSTYARREQER